MPRQPDTTQIVIANIAYYQALNGVNDKELCSRAQLAPSTYSRKMRRVSNRAFDLDELGRIARVLKTTVADLVKGGPA